MLRAGAEAQGNPWSVALVDRGAVRRCGPLPRPRRSRSASRTRSSPSPMAACRPGCARTARAGARWSGWCCASTARSPTPRSSRSRTSWDRPWPGHRAGIDRCGLHALQRRPLPRALLDLRARSGHRPRAPRVRAGHPPREHHRAVGVGRTLRVRSRRHRGPRARRAQLRPLRRGAAGPSGSVRAARAPPTSTPMSSPTPAGRPATASSTTRSASAACAAGPTASSPRAPSAWVRRATTTR